MAYNFSESIQKGILYLLKTDDNFFAQILNLIKADYFEYPVHSAIFQVVVDYHSKYTKLPQDAYIVELYRDLKAPFSISELEEELEQINNIKALTENQDFYLDLVEKFAKKEAIKRAIVDAVQLIKNDRIEEIEELVKKAISITRVIDLGQDYFSGTEARWDRLYNPELKDVFPTLLPTISSGLEGGGLSRKELAMVVAPAGVGKSLYLVNQSVSLLMEGRNVVYISLEMAEDKIAQRFDSVMTLVPQAKIKDSIPRVKDRLKMFQDTFGGKLVIKEFPCSQANVFTIRSYLDQLKNQEGFNPDVLVIDYLELLRPVREGLQEYNAQQRVAEELRGLCMERNMLCWTATQTNREGKKVKIITDAELADCYGKIRVVDLAISLNQDDEEFNGGRIRVYVMKARNGRARYLVPMSVNYNNLRMSELDTIDEEIAPITVVVEQN